VIEWGSFVDPIYGQIRLTESLRTLVQKPVLQRLRHVRLSNIDSIDIPSIANLSRFEHVLGVAHLASSLGIRSSLTRHELLVLDASALLHDWAITSFGHLVEEGLQYVGTNFDHEQRLREIILGISHDEVLGADLQILAGRGAGIRDWARTLVGHDDEQLLRDIMDHIRGGGRLGRLIAGDIDIDNIDNVFRMAFHMGLDVDRRVPSRLAKAIIGINDGTREPIFKSDSEADIQAWRMARRRVYEHLMLAERDFIGKVMILSSTVKAFQAGEIVVDDWKMVDHDFITRLLGSHVREVKDTTQSWLAGDLWSCTPLYWMKGQRPSYPALLEVSGEISTHLNRYCFAYGIKDKRERVISAHFDDGRNETYGNNAERWLLGIGSSNKRPFSTKDVRFMFDAACKSFETEVIGPSSGPEGKDDQAWLL
jgi:HD superfamily phosphohydrolase